MPSSSPIVVVDRILEKLTKEWHRHRDALAKIEAVFSKYGIKPVVKAAPATPAVATEPAAAPKARKGRRRHRHAVSGTNFILGLLSGGKVLTTAQISAAWKEAGRTGKADQPLSKLVAVKKVKRQPIKDAPGSKYSVA